MQRIKCVYRSAYIYLYLFCIYVEKHLVSVTLVGNLLTLPQLQQQLKLWLWLWLVNWVAARWRILTYRNAAVVRLLLPLAAVAVAVVSTSIGCNNNWATSTHVRLNLGVCRRTYAALTTNLHSRRLAKATYNPSKPTQLAGWEAPTGIARDPTSKTFHTERRAQSAEP